MPRSGRWPRRRWPKLSSKLSRQHLEAIGRVAAEWSSLEMAMIETIGDISDVGFVNACVLAGPSAFASWVDMLTIMTQQSTKHAHNEKYLDALCRLMKKLLTLRNYIVHANWEYQVRNTSTTHYVMVPIVLNAADNAVGIGIPKRGKKFMVDVRWTSLQMQTVARFIAKSRSLLRGMPYRQPPTSPKEQRALARSDRTILRQIQTMLDTLPDPFQKLKEKQSSRLPIQPFKK